MHIGLSYSYTLVVCKSVYEVQRQKTILNLSQGHHRMVYSVAWSPDSHQTTERCNLFSAGFDNKVIGWKVSFRTAAVVGYLASHQDILCTANSVLLASAFVFVSVALKFFVLCVV